MWPKIILIGNYPPDKQLSMDKFSKMLYQEFSKKEIDCTIWKPEPFLLKIFPKSKSIFNNWIAYVDKYILFPIVLISKTIFLNKAVKIHICDHSNAMYGFFFKQSRLSITCHDVLAIQGAMGIEDSYCESTVFGKYLQKWILFSLTKIPKIICVSNYTKNNLVTLSNQFVKSNISVIYNSFNISFHQELSIDRLPFQLIGRQYLLHIGSGLPRKNRKFLLSVLAKLKSDWDICLCYVGEKLSFEMLEEIEKNKLNSSIINIVNPADDILLTILNHSEALLFPSLSEGFGWPIIEAQACGIPVVISNKQPMIEIGGDGILKANPTNAKEFANEILKLKNQTIKDSNIKAGFENIKRFNSNLMTTNYIDCIFEK